MCLYIHPISRNKDAKKTITGKRCQAGTTQVTAKLTVDRKTTTSNWNQETRYRHLPVSRPHPSVYDISFQLTLFLLQK